MQKKKVLPWEFCIWSIWWKGKTGHGVDIEHAVTLRGISIRWSWALNGKKWLAGDVTLMKLDIWMVWSPNNDECKSDGVRRLSLDGRGDTWQNRVPCNIWNARRRHQRLMAISQKWECRGSPQTCTAYLIFWTSRMGAPSGLWHNGRGNNTVMHRWWLLHTASAWGVGDADDTEDAGVCRLPAGDEWADRDWRVLYGG